MNLYPERHVEWVRASHSYGKKIKGPFSGRRPKDIEIHPESWVDLDDLNKKGAYRKTFKFEGPFVDPIHEGISRARKGMLDIEIAIDLGIEGYLQEGDVLKLYELARLTSGDVLELGTHFGLSTSVIAHALERRGAGSLETVDIYAPTTSMAAENLRGMPGEERVTFTVQDGAQRMAELADQGRRYGFIFVDHWHGYQATLDAANQLHRLLEPAGFVQFHDFADDQNADLDHFYGVFQAVLDSVCKDKRFLFCGNYGCTGVFRYQP